MEIDIEQWVSEAQQDYLLARQATHIILRAISASESLRTSMIIKGGTLLGIRYGSTRFTTDIDFSTEKKLSEIDLPEFIQTLNDSMDIVETGLNYGIKCNLQSHQIKPNAQGTFPTIKMKIAYCYRSNAAQMKRLNENNCPHVIAIDYSFNEKSYNVELLQLGDHNGEIQAYDICDLLAEKIRSILQQAERKRNREQDVYDVHYLLNTIKPLSHEEMAKVLWSLRKKSEDKGIDHLLNAHGIDDPEIKQRSSEGYGSLIDTVESLPDFEDSYASVSGFFKALPWDDA